MTIEEFRQKVKENFNDKIAVIDTDYKGYNQPMLFKCLKHGEFITTPRLLLGSKHGCKECANDAFKKSKQITEEVFLERCYNKFNGKFNYGEGKFIDYNKMPMKIICPIHGETWQIPKFHLQSKKGCQMCAGFKNGVVTNKKIKTTQEFIEEAESVYQIEDDFSKVNYQGAHEKITIICPKHGDFEVTASNYLRGNRGCKECAIEAKREKQSKPYELFVEEVKKVHGNKYDYSKVEYVNCSTKVCIICPIHGEFWQTPSDHMSGAGCPICMESHLERRIRQFLEDNNIVYNYEQVFEWLTYKRKLSLDFYLPELNIAIECQGIQHFEPTNFFGSLKTKDEQNTKFEEIIQRDKLKKELCESHNIKLLYFTDLDKEIFLGEKLIKDENELLTYVRKK